MTTFALTLVLSSAVIHAYWNFLAKRTSGGVAFMWLFSLIGALLFTPLAIGDLILNQPQISLPGVIFMAGSGLLHAIYFFLLTRAYRVGDLSLVYPLARGTGPLLTTIFAILLLGERPTPLALAGTLLIVIGVFAFTGDPRKLRTSGAGPGILYALLTGVSIAGYTLWDKYGVGELRVPPLVYSWGTGMSMTAILTIFIGRDNWGTVREAWHDHRSAAIGVGVLSPSAYLLILFALTFSPVSYIAPAREVSTLIGAIMGARLLAEGDISRRLAAAGAIVLGVVALAFG